MKSDIKWRRDDAISAEADNLAFQVKKSLIVNYLTTRLLALVDILLLFYFVFDLPADILKKHGNYFVDTASAAVHDQPTLITCNNVGVCSGGWSTSSPGGHSNTASLLLHLSVGVCVSLPMSVIEMLLVMGGVEQNPGPITPEQYTARLAELLIDAPSEDIKKVLSGWRVDKPRNSFYGELKKLKVPALKITLAWLLNVAVTHDNVKTLKLDQLTAAATTALESLLPDECDQCKESFHFLIGEKPKISCSGCLQGFHQKCLDEMLGVHGVLPDLPWKSTYLCCHCSPRYAMMTQGGTAPSLTDKRRTLAEELAKARNDGQNVIPVIDVIPADQNNVPNPKNVQGSASLIQPTAVVSAATQVAAQPGVANLTEESAAEQTEAPLDNQAEVENSTNGVTKSDKTCALFMKGECQYGIKGKDCPDLHPKPCKLYMKWGNIHENGCKNGAGEENEPGIVKCDKGVHSTVCPESLHFRCDKQDCPFKLHILKSHKKKPKKTPEPGPATGRSNPNRRPPGGDPYNGRRRPDIWNNPWIRHQSPWTEPPPRVSQKPPNGNLQSLDFQLATTIQNAIQASLEAQISTMQATLMEKVMVHLKNRLPQSQNLSHHLNQTEWPQLSHFY